MFAAVGVCSYGWKCRFLASHSRQLGEGEGFQGCGMEMIADESKMRSVAKVLLHGDDAKVAAMDLEQLKAMVSSTKGEFNVVTGDRQRLVSSYAFVCLIF